MYLSIENTSKSKQYVYLHVCLYCKLWAMLILSVFSDFHVIADQEN